MSPRGYCPAMGDGTQTTLIALDPGNPRYPLSMPGSLRDAIDSRAKGLGKGRSEYVRGLVMADLEAAGITYERYAMVPARTIKERKAGVKG